MSVDCVFVDPHMHLWDFEEHADVHERRFLAGVRERALSSHYDREIGVGAFAVRSSVSHTFSQAHRPVQQIVVVEALPLLPLKEIDVFSADAKVGAFVAACDLRKDASMLHDIASRSSKVRPDQIVGDYYAVRTMVVRQ